MTTDKKPVDDSDLVMIMMMMMAFVFDLQQLLFLSRKDQSV